MKYFAEGGALCRKIRRSPHCRILSPSFFPPLKRGAKGYKKGAPESTGRWYITRTGTSHCPYSLDSQSLPCCQMRTSEHSQDREKGQVNDSRSSPESSTPIDLRLDFSLMRLRGMECNSPRGYAEAFYRRKSVLGFEVHQGTKE